MTYTQGDIVEVNFLFPNGTFKPHPAIIVSNDQLQLDDDTIYIVLISSKNYNPQYSYTITPDMIDVALPKQSYIKCHLIVANTHRDIIKKIGKFRQPYLDQAIDKIIESIF